VQARVTRPGTAEAEEIAARDLPPARQSVVGGPGVEATLRLQEGAEGGRVHVEDDVRVAEVGPWLQLPADPVVLRRVQARDPEDVPAGQDVDGIELRAALRVDPGLGLVLVLAVVDARVAEIPVGVPLGHDHEVREG
jgi:hypothetical protein